jgi:hypothetical protein
MIICTSYSGIASAEPLRRPAGTSADRGRDHHIEDRPGRRKYPIRRIEGGLLKPGIPRARQVSGAIRQPIPTTRRKNTAGDR